MNWTKQAFAIAIAFVLWLVPSLGQLMKYFGPGGMLVASGIAFGAIVACIGALPNWRELQGARLFVPALMLLVAVLFAILYPLAKSGLLGLGSDRDDALDAALHALLHGQYPYYTQTYLGNPPTPAPGALLFALPFYLLGSGALQNLFWIPAFGFYSRWVFRDHAVAAAYCLIFVVGCPAALQDFVTGGDYLANAIYVGIAVDLVTRTHEESHSAFLRFAAQVFLAWAISSRVIYAIALPVLAVFLWQRGGARAALAFLAIETLLILAINGPFYAYDPGQFAPLTLGRKLGAIPGTMRPSIVLPALSIGVALSSALIRLDRTRVLAAIALALVPAFVTPLVFSIARLGWTRAGLMSAGYALPISIYGGVALLDWFRNEWSLCSWSRKTTTVEIQSLTLPLRYE